MREAGVTPRLRFPEFRNTKGWDVRILGEEGEFLSSLTGKGAEHFGIGKAKYVPYMNVFTNTFTDMTALGTVDVNEDESQNAIAEGDVLFTVSSETPEEAGMSSVVLQSVDACYLNSFCTIFRFRPSEKRPNLHFLGYLMRQPVVRAHLAKRAQGSTRFNLSKDAFRSTPIAVPSTAEQQRIADCLTSLDDVIAAQVQKMAALKEHKQGLMRQLFPGEGEVVPRLRFPEFRTARAWEAKRLEDVAPLQRGFDLPSSDIAEGDVPVVYSNGIGSYHNVGMATGPGLVTGRSGTIGKLHYIEHGEYWPHNTSLWVTTFRGHNPRFVYYLYSAIGLERFASGSGVPTLNRNDVHAFEACVPASAEEQQRIADCLSSLDAKIVCAMNKLSRLKLHKQGLLQQLFPSTEGQP